MQGSGIGGRPILIAGTRETSDNYAEGLRRAGFTARGYGVLDVRPVMGGDELRGIEGTAFDVVIFTSRNAVRFFLSSASQLLRARISRCMIYAVGEGTGGELRLHGFYARVPARESLAGLLEELRGEGLKGRIVGVFHSSRVDEGFIRGLEELGASIHSFPLYEVFTNRGEARRLLEDIKRDASAIVMFLAGGAFRALMDMDARVPSLLKDRLVLALGEATGETLRHHGIPHHALQRPSVGSAVAAIKRLLEERAVKKGGG